MKDFIKKFSIFFSGEHTLATKRATGKKTDDSLPLKPIKLKQIKPISNDSSLLKSHSKLRAWLEKNSLAKLNLTILDVLLDQSSKRKDNEPPENMLVVDDLYDAHVWNEVTRYTPLRFVSNYSRIYF